MHHKRSLRAAVVLGHSRHLDGRQTLEKDGVSGVCGELDPMSPWQSRALASPRIVVSTGLLFQLRNWENCFSTRLPSGSGAAHETHLSTIYGNKSNFMLETADCSRTLTGPCCFSTLFGVFDSFPLGNSADCSPVQLLKQSSIWSENTCQCLTRNLDE